MVDYPNEFITSVEGTFEGYENRVQHPDRRITSLIFKTSKEKTSKIFGAVDGKKPVKFVLERKDCALVGFHGWFSNQNLSTLGAYIFPLPPPPSDSYVDKLEAQGGDGGVSWDGGANFDGVKKIYIGNCEIGVAFVKFLYDKETEVVVGEDHGRKTLNEVKEVIIASFPSRKLFVFWINLFINDLFVLQFELEYPSEYLISVEGRYDKIDGIESKVLVMLKFKTNKRTSQAFGLDMVSNFVLHKEGHKIVGFHGKANNMLHQIGVHVLPITN